VNKEDTVCTSSSSVQPGQGGRVVAQIQETLPSEFTAFLQIRYFDTVPLYFAYVRIDDRFLITHYMCSANSSSSPMFFLQGVGGSWSKAYVREFETIWRLAKTDGTRTAAASP
jgi:hypothetical protein